VSRNARFSHTDARIAGVPGLPTIQTRQIALSNRQAPQTPSVVDFYRSINCNFLD
jgi:hypothetical protein